MSANYSFVKMLARGQLTGDALAATRRSAIPGSHTDLILKEALLDRDGVYDIVLFRTALAHHSASDDFVVCSFPGAFPNAELVGIPLNLRSEFLILGALGNRQLDLDNTGACAEAILRPFRACTPPAVVYRLCDCNLEDFSFLKFSGRRIGDPPRGAQLLIDEPRLLGLDLKIIEGLLKLDISVDILVPFIQFAFQFEFIRHQCITHFQNARRKHNSIGAVLEVPANLLEISAYRHADFFVFGANDLLKHLHGGVDRNSRHYRRVNHSILVSPVREALEKIDEFGGRRVYLMKSLIDMADSLQLDDRTNITFARFFMPHQLATAGLHDRPVVERTDQQRRSQPYQKTRKFNHEQHISS